MTWVTALFPSPADARKAIEALRSQGIDDSQFSYIAPGEREPTPVTPKRAGAVIGGVLGIGASTFLIPGLGPIIGFGALAGALAGAGAGAAAGAAAESYFHEEAVRSGGAVVAVDARDPDQETQVRNILEHLGGRPTQWARREWWQGIRGGERDFARSRGIDFDAQEADYRDGFEAALHPQTRGRDYEEVVAYIETCYPEPCKTDVFRIAYDRGREYLQRGRVASGVH
jgi:hypothetical protein